MPDRLRVPQAERCRRAGAARRAARTSPITSGTLFAFHKLPLRTYLAAIAIFVNEVKGKSALALSRDLGVQYKTLSCWRTNCARRWRPS